MADKNTEIHHNNKSFEIDASAHFKKRSINVNGQLISFERPRVMGILNITPDSFYAGSRISSIDQAISAASKMISEGADFLDVGAYSSRPGAADVAEEEEVERLIPVLKALVKEFPAVIFSVDTFRAQVAEAGIEAGAHIINDISGGDLDSNMIATVARLKVPYIIMHMKGTPQTMKQFAQYEDVVNEVFKQLYSKIQRLKQAGVLDYIVDPGFGFAKNIEQNYELLNQFEFFKELGAPLLAGVSRKSMIWKVLNIDNKDALNGTTVLNTVALMKGADILRVHDVRPAVEAVTLLQKLRRNKGD